MAGFTEKVNLLLLISALFIFNLIFFAKDALIFALNLYGVMLIAFLFVLTFFESFREVYEW
ncbi:MAG: hypothetical protein QW625_01270 [Candidatus Nanoarchaeia archaeon]